MYHQVATRLYLSDTDEYSQAISMEGANAVSVEAVAISSDVPATTSVTIDVQVSNDLENWQDEGTVQISGLKAPGYAMKNSTGGSIPAAFVRLKYSLTAGAGMVVSAGINTANL